MYVYVMCFYVCCFVCLFFFFKQKTAYEMRISDWSSDVCSSDLHRQHHQPGHDERAIGHRADLAHPAADRRAEDDEIERGGDHRQDQAGDRKSIVEGKSVSVRVDLGGRRIIKKKKE